MSVRQFILSGRPNAWVKHGQYEVYVRRGFHLVGDAVGHCLDLASITCPEEKRGKGKFDGVLKKMVELGKEYEFDALFVESVLNERLADYLLRYGMTKVGDFAPSFYLKLKG